MTLNDIWTYLNAVTNKSQTGNTVSPTEFNSLFQAANLRYFLKKIGAPEDYQPGIALPRQNFEQSQVNTESLRPFKVHMGKAGTMPLPVNSDGYATLPSDYYYPSSLGFWDVPTGCDPIPELRKIDVLTDAQWNDIVSHPLRKPTRKYPVCNFQNTYIRFLPANLQRVDFVYLRYPKDPVYDYYISSIGEHVYLPSGTSYTLQAGEQGSQGQLAGTVTSQTVELEWGDEDILDIINLVLKDMGMNLREMPVIQYAVSKEQTGT